MVISDACLTPAISVLSAVGGLKEKAPHLNTEQVVWVTVGILVALFAVQRFGTDKVGYLFAPVVLLWLLLIGGVGVYNLAAHDVGVLRAFNPKYILDYFRRNGRHGWVSLGGVLLCFTGTEALFADLGCFSIRSIQLSFAFGLVPAVLLAYAGQAAYLRSYPEQVADAFYASTPQLLFWPTFVLALAASVVGSQAMISCAFATISHSQAMGCFPRVKIVRTSRQYQGQVYIPEINFLLGAAACIVTLAARDTVVIGEAHGICVVLVMLITTLLLTVVMLLVWRVNVWWVAVFLCVFASTESVYLTSVLYKFLHGGYIPVAMSAAAVAGGGGGGLRGARAGVQVRAGADGVGGAGEGADDGEGAAACARRGAVLHGPGAGHPAGVPAPDREDPVHPHRAAVRVGEAPPRATRGPVGAVPFPAGGAAGAEDVPVRGALRLPRPAGGGARLRGGAGGAAAVLRAGREPVRRRGRGGAGEGELPELAVRQHRHGEVGVVRGEGAAAEDEVGGEGAGAAAGAAAAAAAVLVVFDGGRGSARGGDADAGGVVLGDGERDGGGGEDEHGGDGADRGGAEVHTEGDGERGGVHPRGERGGGAAAVVAAEAPRRQLRLLLPPPQLPPGRQDARHPQDPTPQGRHVLRDLNHINHFTFTLLY
uniref:K+ potassium transporter integral membrane domain-containing protein n=1 Tax=Oryza brachyantha TaxID=4533 RepID=J3MHZ1_ORYBR